MQQENDQIDQASPSENPEFGEEMDLTPYLDDSDEILHQKLVYAKRARKQAEDDLRLLLNRIGLLKTEEGKALKKIDETRKKTGNVIEQKIRNDHAFKEKVQRHNIMRAEEEFATAKHREMKQVQYERLTAKKESIREKVWAEATTVKMVKSEAKQQKKVLQDNHEVKVAHQNMAVRQQHVDTAYKREQHFMSKQMKARELLEEKMVNEEEARVKHEQDIINMEAQENELIQRLKNTQQLVNDANEQLERAYTAPNPDPVAYRKTNSRQGVRMKPPSSSSKAMRR